MELGAPEVRGEVLHDVARTVSSDGLAALNAIAGLGDSIMLEEGNATERLTESGQALLREDVDVNSESIYASLTSVQTSDGTALQGAIDASNECYADFTVRVSEEEDIHRLYRGGELPKTN